MNNIHLTASLVKEQLGKIKALILQLTDEQFCQELAVLSGASIGEHVRHQIEFYLCLFNQIDTGIISYDNRRRDQRIEKEKEFAIRTIDSIITSISSLNEDKRLHVSMNLSCEEGQFILAESSLSRELAYNIEHGIHHQALIKIGLAHFMEIKVEEDFGIAPATLRFKKFNSG